MRKARGIIALAIAVVLGLVAARAVMVLMNKPKKPVSPRVSAPKPSPEPKFSIPEGMRVVTLRVKETLSGPEPLKAGDRVDIVATSPLKGKAGNLSRIIMENVPVHYVSREGVSAKRLVAQAQEQNVAFLLSPAEAVSLVAAGDGAAITLLPRSRKTAAAAGQSRENRHRFLYTPEEGVQVLPATARPLAREIPQGMRAVTLKLDDTDGLCGRLVPGDRVDVILTSLVAFVRATEDHSAGATAKLSKSEYSSRTMLENIAVIGTETTFETGAAPMMQPEKLVTLLVTPQQALKLTASSGASKKARLRLVARHPEDEQSVATHKENLKALLSKSREYRRVPVMRGMTTMETPFYQ